MQIKDTEKAVLAEGFSGQSASMTDSLLNLTLLGTSQWLDVAGHLNVTVD